MVMGSRINAECFLVEPEDNVLSGGQQSGSAAIPTVCQVLHSLGVGGAEVLAARMARRLCHDHRFVFVCLDELGVLGEQLQDEGFPIFTLHRESGFDWRCSQRLAGILQRERVDLIHSHQYAPFFYAALSRFISSHPPVLFTEHGRDYPDRPRPKRIIANRLLLRNNDHAVGVGVAVRQALIDIEKLPPDRVSVIYNGIHLGPYEAETSTEHRLATRSSIGIAPEDFMIVQVARLDYLKDHATAIRALAELVRIQPKCKLVLVGEGPQGKSIRQMVKELSLECHVWMLGLRNDVPQLLRAADLMVLTSISEGIPLTLIEGMAAGLPVVSTRVGGVGEVVEDGRTGLLSAAGDHMALARSITRFAENLDLRCSVGNLGRERAFSLFSENRMHDQYSTLYKKIIKN